jgi:glycosyltransferase involved in cell wall biosynthesis
MSAASTALRGRQILCLATQEWDANWTPVQQVMSRLAPENEVLYVEPFHALPSRLMRGNAVFQRQIREGVPALREVQPNLRVYRPRYPYAPWNMKSSAAHALNGMLYPAEIASLLRRTGFRRPILWAFFAQNLRVLDLGFSAFIYDCVDDWPSFFSHPVERAFITRIDAELTRRAQIVFVGSGPLLEKKRSQNSKVFVVNHAADIPHFAKAADPATVVPDDLARIPRPRVGFVGMIDELRFDGELIALLAENPEYQIVIVGGFQGNARKVVPDRPNIHVLGMRKVAELPSYLAGMDVCMMPYRRNETTRYIFPLKLFEYLATGKPTVSMAIPAVENLRHLVRVADSYEEFLAHVRAALTADDPADVQRRMEFSRRHGWEQHVEKKLALIAGHLPLERLQ